VTETHTGTNLNYYRLLPVFLNSSPNSLALQCQLLFNKGIAGVMTLAITSSESFAALAYRSTPTLDAAGFPHAKRNLNVAPAVGTIGLALYAQVLMGV